jgi:hypothetical protein
VAFCIARGEEGAKTCVENSYLTSNQTRITGTVREDLRTYMSSLVINVTIVTFVTKVTYFHLVAVVTDVNVFAFVFMKKSVYAQRFIMVI